MKSINFAIGKKKYIINGDENNFIEVCTTDPNLRNRLQNALTEIQETISGLEGADFEALEAMDELDKKIKENIDKAFDADVSKHAFGNMSTLTLVEDESGGTEALCMAFLNAFIPEVLDDVEKTIEKVNKESTAEGEKTLKAVQEFDEFFGGGSDTPLIRSDASSDKALYEDSEEYKEFLEYKKAKEKQNLQGDGDDRSVAETVDDK